MSMRVLLRMALVLSATLSVSGCSFILSATPQSTTPERACAPPTRVFDVQAGEESGGSSVELQLSEQSIEVAKVMNILPLLSQLTTLQRAPVGSTRLSIWNYGNR
jgi:hypothetical protein